MQTSATFYKKIQAEVGDIVATSMQEMKDKALKELDLANASVEERLSAEKKIHQIEFLINKDISESLRLTEKQLEANRKVELTMSNMKELVDKLTVQIRQPSVAANKVLSAMGGWAPALLKANQEGKSFVDIVAAMGVKLQETGKSALKLFGPTGILIGGIALATAAMAGLFKLFTNYWDFLDKKVIPAQANFAKEVGGSKASTAGLRKEMISTRCSI